MRCDQTKNQMDDNKPFYDLYLKDYLKRQKDWDADNRGPDRPQLPEIFA